MQCQEVCTPPASFELLAWVFTGMKPVLHVLQGIPHQKDQSEKEWDASPCSCLSTMPMADHKVSGANSQMEQLTCRQFHACGPVD